MNNILDKIRQDEINYEQPDEGLVKPTYVTEDYVVQEAKEGSEEKLRKNAFLCELLYDNGVSVPRVFEVNEDPVHVVFEKLEGESLENRDSFENSAYLKAVENAGRELAKMHDVKVSGYGKPDEKKGLEKGSYDSWRKFVEDYVDGTLNYVESERFGPIAQQASEVIDFEEIPEESVSGVLHMDFTLDNVIVDNEFEAHVIDFDGALYGDPGLDLMYAEIIMSKHGDDVLEAFRKGYESVRAPGLSEEERMNYTALAVMRDLRGGEWCLRNQKDVDLDEWSEGLQDIIEGMLE